jgi:hypothetical protein
MTVEWHVNYNQDRHSIAGLSERQIAEYAAAWSVSRERTIIPEMQVKVPVCA